MSNYAIATREQWFADDFPGTRFDPGPNCGVIHTTEGTSWPDYDGGAKAPNYTAKPDFKAKRLVWRAHFPDEMSSRALRNLAGGVETNTLNSVQVELVGTCDPRTHASWTARGIQHIYWPEAPDWALRDLAAFLVDMHKRHGIPIQGPDVWLAYPASYGASPVRFTFAQWRRFLGWCGHQHVPENLHGDPGALPWDRIVELALAMLEPPVKPWQRRAWPKPKTAEVVAYANIFVGMLFPEARAAFNTVRATGADLVGLGEFGSPRRKELLARDDQFIWVKPDGAPPAGADKDRYMCIGSHRRLLAKGRDVERVPGRKSKGHLGDNYANVATWREIATGDLVTTVVVHFASGGSVFAQPRGVLRRISGSLSPRARMVREAKRETRAIVQRHWSRGRRVYVLGDTNVHNMRLWPLISCWAGNTLRRTINRSTYDTVYAQQPAAGVRTVVTGSDHKAVVATYPKGA